MMGDWEKVKRVFDEIDFNFDVTEFEDRLIAQKIICLLDLKGVDIKYQFNFYIRGPYSPNLAADYYSNRLVRYEHGDSNILSDEETEIIHQVDQIFGKSPSLLEIGATYGFVLQKMDVSPTDALKIVKQKKGFYPDSQIAKGISKAKQLLVTPTEEDLIWLKNEVKPWQRAATQSMRR
jgi:uncharacterized protein YwgA